MFTKIDNDFKQIQIAMVLNISQAQYSYIENGKNQLYYLGLIKLSEFKMFLSIICLD